jgi:hypothetical protein
MVGPAMHPCVCHFGLDGFRRCAPAVSDDAVRFGWYAHSVLTARRAEPQSPPPPLGAEIPFAFREMIESCWMGNQTSFEHIVETFFGKAILTGLSEAEIIEFRHFQGMSLAPNFVIKAIAKACTRIQRIEEKCDELFGTVEHLTAEVKKKRPPPIVQIEPLQQDNGEFGVRAKSTPFMLKDETVPETLLSFRLRSAPDMHSAQVDQDMIMARPRHQETSAGRFLPPTLDVTNPSEYGIIHALTEKYGGNIVQFGFLMITGNSMDDSRDRMLGELVNYEWRRCWTSKNVPNSWVQFDFPTLTMRVTHYGIKTYPMGQGFSHLKSWAFQTLEGAQWKDLHVQENTTELNGRSQIGIFPVNRIVEGQSFRLKQVGVNHAGDHFLILTNVEFYGMLLGDG